MISSPVLWGAALACALGGAIAGNAVGSLPVTDRAAVSAPYQSHDTIAARRIGEAMPDHYPLVTRAGTVPVAQLSERGLFSQSRYRTVLAAATYPDRMDEEYDHAFEALEPTVSGTGPGPVEPVPQSDTGAASPAEAGHAKIIDVPATLAMR